MKYYHNPRCSKSREGLEIIKAAKKEIIIVDYLKTGLTKTEVQAIVKLLAQPLTELIRSKETIFKETGLNLKELNKAQIIDLLVQYPSLLERPLLVSSKMAIIGRPPEVLKKII